MTQPARPVLVVDDNPVIREILRRQIEAAGFGVLEAPDGVMAMKYLQRNASALVVLDLLMAGMDGFKFLEAVRRRPEWAALPVIVLTAKPLSEAECATVSAQADALIRKSDTSTAEVIALVKTLLAPPAQ